MSTTGIERPIELAPEATRRLLVEGRGELVLPMASPPALGPMQVAALRGALMEIGCWVDSIEPAEMLDMAFREGLLPDMRCPWGRGGDELWVRESWAAGPKGWLYAARDAAKSDGVVWRPAVAMPRAAARLVVKIDDVGVGLDSARALAWVVAVEVRR